ncbi:MAG: hypothetical protein JWR51_4702 [Devosia sp.]|uniref:hypothetical protein n=1 Tax=Devosia sp. TaxID=1871048 RepID=UPI00261C5C8F|nr:hypothetical protein [Devosia sp.]MDB5531599.1 hypothetical protein [Devosia sp.]
MAASAFPYDLVLVEWVDACRLNNSWIDVSEVPEPYQHKCVSVGFLFSENEHGLVVVPTIGDTAHPDNSHTYGGMMIPASAVIRRKKLR